MNDTLRWSFIKEVDIVVSFIILFNVERMRRFSFKPFVRVTVLFTYGTRISLPVIDITIFKI